MASRLGRHVISSTEIVGLPVLNFGGQIRLVDLTCGGKVSTDEIRELLGISVGNRVIGFDTEAKPSPSSSLRNRTALIQLASEHSAVLFRTMGCTSLPSSLLSVLEDPEVVKVGQGIGGDIGFLREDFNFPYPSNLIDLHAIACKLNCQPKSLQGLVGLFLNKRLLKDMRISNWEDAVLSHQQIQYAAIDAWATRAVYLSILDRNLIKDFPPLTRTVQPIALPSFPPLPSPAKTFSSPQVELVDYCLVNGYVLRLGKTMKEASSIKCVFEIFVSLSMEPLQFVSSRAHKSIREAQIDAAQVALEHFKSEIHI